MDWEKNGHHENGLSPELLFVGGMNMYVTPLNYWLQ